MANQKQKANGAALTFGGDDWIGQREIKAEAKNWRNLPQYSGYVERWKNEGLSDEEMQRRVELFGECVLESKIMDKQRKDEILAKSRKQSQKSAEKRRAETEEKEPSASAETETAETAQNAFPEPQENGREILEAIIREAESDKTEPCSPEGARRMAGESAAALGLIRAAGPKTQKKLAKGIKELTEAAASLSAMGRAADGPEEKKALGDSANAVRAAIADFEGLLSPLETLLTADGLIGRLSVLLVSTADDRQDKVDILKTNSEISSCPPSTDKIHNGHKKDPSLSGKGGKGDPGDDCGPDLKPEKEKKEKKAMEKDEKSQNQYSQRKKTGKKRGGQPNHKGRALSKREIEKKIAAGEIELAGTRHIGDPGEPEQSDQYEIEIVTKVTATRIVYHKGAKRAARVPCVYGGRLTALCVVLMMHYGLSEEMARECLSDLTGGVLDLSGGFVMDTLKTMDKACEGPIREIEECLLKSPVLFTDATGSRVGKRRRWVRCVRVPDAARYYKMKTKRKEELAGIGVLGKFKGTLARDHELACYVLDQCARSECGARGIRRLTKVSVETGHSWAGNMIELLCKMKRTRDEAKAAGRSSLEKPVLDSLLGEFSQVIREGKAENKASRFLTPKRLHYEMSLLRDLEAYRSQYLRFLLDFKVPFTNNLSEQALRRVAARRRKIGCFRTEEGLGRYCNIISVIGAVRRKGLPMLKTVTEIIGGEFRGFGFGAA